MKSSFRVNSDARWLWLGEERWAVERRRAVVSVEGREIYLSGKEVDTEEGEMIQIGWDLEEGKQLGDSGDDKVT